MNMKKTLIGAAVACGLGFGSQSQALITGAVGEALLVPLAWYTQEEPPDNLGEVPFANTWVMLHTVSNVGTDTVPNLYTAPHVSAQPGGNSIFENPGQCSPAWDPTVGEDYWYANGCDALHWFFFNHKSEEIANGPLKVSPNDKYLFSLRDQAPGAPNNLELGYLVFVNQVTLTTPNFDGVHPAATIAIAADAILQIDDMLTAIPVLPMPDGEDNATASEGWRSQISRTNNCVTINQIPHCSPTIPGTRLSMGDGDNNDYVLVDWEIFTPWFSLNFLVSWLDANYGVQNVPVDIYDEHERYCSSTFDLPYELNVTLVTPPYTGKSFGQILDRYVDWLDADPGKAGVQPPEWLGELRVRCTIFNWSIEEILVTGTRPNFVGFIAARIPELGDTIPNTPDGGVQSAGAFFNLAYPLFNNDESFTEDPGANRGREDWSYDLIILPAQDRGKVDL